MPEGLGERPIRRLHHGVTRAVEHERATSCRVSRELADQAALARPGLAAQKRDPPALSTLGRRQESAEPLELYEPPDERKR
jgi:hypothetical protein